MEKLKELVFDWLIELEKQTSADFLNNCEIEQSYIDLVFELDNDAELCIFDITIRVPLKIHRKIDNYSQEILDIESAIREIGESDGIIVRTFKWLGYLQNEDKKKLDKKAEEITQLLTQEYVNKQIKIMNNSIESNPHLAIGVSKELIETCCKHILNKAGIKFSKDWDIAKLVKETNKQIDLMPFEVDNIELAKSSITKITGGFSNIVHGITELRNSYGSGHGHSPEFKSLDLIYVKLAVSASSELAIFYLSLYKLQKEKSNN